MLKDMRQHEENFVKVAVEKDVTIIPTKDLDQLKKDVKELQAAQQEVLDNPDKPEKW